MAIIVLEHPPFRLDLDPDAGCRVQRFERQGTGQSATPIFAPAATGADGAPKGGCFPLVPFSNRIAHGRFRFDGRDVALPPDRLGLPHAIHGHGWKAPWRVERADQAEAVVAFDHEPDAWPWAYGARQTYGLDADGLTVTLSLENRSDRPMPAGLGLHPYFPRPAGTTVRVAVDRFWRGDATNLPVEQVAASDTMRTGAAWTVGDQVWDNCFAGWSGTAVIAMPSAGLEITIEADPPFGHLVIFVPEGRDFFCLEPVSHANNAVNLKTEGTGPHILEPGAVLTGTIRIRVASSS